MLAQPSLVPRPSVLQVSDGRFTLDRRTAIVASKGLGQLAKALKDDLRATGLPLPSRSEMRTNVLLLQIDAHQALGPEGYTLDADAQGVRIAASKPAGVFYGIQTLRQLLPTSLYDPTAGGAFAVPFVHIEDRPNSRGAAPTSTLCGTSCQIGRAHV